MFKSPALASLLCSLLLLSASPGLAEPTSEPRSTPPTTATTDDPGSDVTLQSLDAELRRTMDGLAEQPEPPYFLSYEVMERRGIETPG